MNKANTQKNGWREVKLGNFLGVKHGFAFKGKHITDEKNKNILVTPGNFHIGGGFKTTKFKYYSGEIPSDYILKDNAIVITITDLSKDGDTLGYSAKIPKSVNGEKYLHNQRIGLLQFHSEEINTDFIYWLLRTPDYHWSIVGAASGTSIRHTSPTTIKDFRFLLPSPHEQQAIAEVLFSLDDKIDLLHRQNKTLEEMAQTLFRKWFVDGAKEEWKNEKFGNIVKITSGKSLKQVDYICRGNYPVLGANGEIGRTNNYFSDEKLIFTGRVGTLGNVFISEGKAWFSDNTLIINPKKEMFYFVYFLLKSAKLEHQNVGSTQPLIRHADIDNIEFLLPNTKLLQDFENQANNFYYKNAHNQMQIKNLSFLRDMLLPKLMKGEALIKNNVKKS